MRVAESGVTSLVLQAETFAGESEAKSKYKGKNSRRAHHGKAGGSTELLRQREVSVQSDG
jgi:hypothetical protein